MYSEPLLVEISNMENFTDFEVASSSKTVSEISKKFANNGLGLKISEMIENTRPTFEKSYGPYHMNYIKCFV